MDSELLELRKLHFQVENSPYCKEKQDMCRRGWELADKLDNYEEQYYFRREYITDATFYGDVMEIYVVFPVMLSKHDEYVKKHGRDARVRNVLWTYKWVIENAKFFYQISQKQFVHFFEDFKRRCIENGFSLRTYYQYGYEFYQKIDSEKAREYYEQFLKQRRDSLSDCHACERNEEVDYLLSIHMYDEAMEKAKDLFSRRLTCTEIPDATYGKFLKYYNQEILAGRMEINEEIQHIVEQLRYSIRTKKLCFEYIGEMLLIYSIFDKAKALAWFKMYCCEAEVMRNPEYKFYFSVAAMHFFGQMKNRKSYRIKLSPGFSQYREDGNYSPNALYGYYQSIAYDVAMKMDNRNETSFYMDFVKLVESYLQDN